MRQEGFEPDPEIVATVADALAGVPRTAYSVPHVYPSAAPAYTRAPMAERPRPAGDELRLYVHLPYCRYRCTFCYFAVRVGADDAAMQRYVGAVQRELEWIPQGMPLSQLFVGGGTPTVLPPQLLDEVLSTVFDRTTRARSGVHTVETSPETISAGHLDVLRHHGIGRVSMGVQSLEEEVLGTVNRDQTAQGALAACELLLGSGMVVNVDLIYGLPGQSRESFLFDLTTLADLGVPSLTLYSLRVTERTPVTRVLGDDRFDLARLMGWRAFAKEAAERRGYTQTRWHTFKRLDTIASTHERLPCFDDDELSGFQLGVGMSARSHLAHTIYRNHASHEAYVERIERDESPVEEIFPLAEDDRITQFVARSIGDGKVLVRADYERAFGRPIDADFGAVIGQLRRGGLLEDDGRVLLLTERGKLVYDLVTLAFYPAHAQAWLAARDDRAVFVELGAPGQG